MISLLIMLLIIVVVAAIAIWLIQTFLPTQPWNNILKAIVGLIILVWLLMYFVPGLHLAH